MGILDKFLGKAVERKSFAPNAGSNTSVFGGSSNKDKYQLALYSVSYACLNLRAQAVSSLDLYFLQENTQSETTELPLDNWLVQLFKHPNSGKTKSEILQLTQKYLDIEGNAYLYTPLNGANVPAQMHTLIPSLVKTKWDKEGNITSYEYHYGNDTYQIPPEEVVHLRTLEPGKDINGDYLGRGLINACLDSVSADKALNRYLARTLQHDLLPPLVYKALVDRPDFDQWRAKVENRDSSGENPRVHILTQLDVQDELVPLFPQGISAGMLNIKDVDSTTVQDICMVFGIPYNYLLGMATSFASAKLDEWKFRMNAIDPLMNYITEKLTEHFKQWQSDIVINYEDFVYTDPDLELRTRESNLNFGLSTINEERAKLGLEPVVGGDVVMVPAGKIPIEQAILGPQPVAGFALSNSSQITKSVEAVVDLEEQKKTEFWFKKQEEIEESAKELDSSLDNLMEELEDIMLSNINSPKGKSLKDLLTKAEIDVEDLFTIDEYDKLVDKHLTKKVRNNVIKNFTNASKQAKLPTDNITTVYKKQIEKTTWAALDKIKMVGSSIKNSIDTFIKNNPGATPKEVEVAVANEIKSYSKGNYKAERVNKTVANFTVNRSAREVWRANDITYFWLTRRDSGVRDSHEKMDGQTVDVEGSFDSVGEDGSVTKVAHPGNFGKPSEDINCRCVIAPRI